MHTLLAETNRYADVFLRVTSIVEWIEGCSHSKYEKLPVMRVWSESYLWLLFIDVVVMGGADESLLG